MSRPPHVSEDSDSSLLVARQRVEAYCQRDALFEQHAQAMKRRDCEDLLQCGIDAYKWLRQADESLREAAKAGFDVGEEAKETLDSLYRSWLRPAAHAERRIREQQEAGFSMANLEGFKAACRFVEKRVRKQEMLAAIDRAFRGDE